MFLYVNIITISTLFELNERQSPASMSKFIQLPQHLQYQLTSLT